MRFLMTTGLIAMCLAATAPAFADDDPSCGDAPRAQWMSQDAAKAKLKDLGYEVRRIKPENGCYEAYALDKAGAKVEVFLHPVSGEVVGASKGD
ncbi:PepSY domain-containing protein [Mycobacterium sp. KBS0706]|uniref:PepSY domain-containing protein n=1 Tax=Mycobacterium sp. KBS0706 TaxID=2578109 RepID=UPI00110FD4E3|nr:PepSY domain-containing protein [Mycobacterium sp. KBS0706]TSD83406.1 PepSY domain-containing protein [Mycobacterium sp. KBS0706]